MEEVEKKEVKEIKSTDWLKKLVISIIVAFLTGFFAYLIPKIMDKGKQLSYSMDTPLEYFGLFNDNYSDIVIEINDKPISSLYLYTIKVWNSGDKPISEFSTRMVFETQDEGFEIYSISHQTTPEYEFGQIEDEFLADQSIRTTYQLMNPGDKDEVIVTTNNQVPLELFSKIEGVKIIKVQDELEVDSLAIFSSVIAFLASTFSFLINIKTSRRKKQRKQYNTRSKGK